MMMRCGLLAVSADADVVVVNPENPAATMSANESTTKNGPLLEVKILRLVAGAAAPTIGIPSPTTVNLDIPYNAIHSSTMVQQDDQ